jgi:hypothetical protein
MPSRHLSPSWLIILIFTVLPHPELHVPDIFKIPEHMAISQYVCENLWRMRHSYNSSIKGMNLTLVLPIFSSS